MPKKIARKSFWLKQGLEPVTAGFTVNRVKTVLTSTRERVKSVKSGTYTMRSVVWRKKNKTGTSEVGAISKAQEAQSFLNMLRTYS